MLSPALTGRRQRLCPSYDHGGSLGFNLTDERRRSYLDEPAAMRRWLEGGTAWRFEHTGRPVTLVEHAAAGIVDCPVGAQWWTQRLHQVDLDAVVEPALARVPELSAVAASFVRTVLALNLERLRGVIYRP